MIERFTIVGGANKSKLHFLAKVLSKDSTFIPFNCSPNRVRHRLSKLANMYKETIERKSKNEMVLKYAMKITLPGFNSQID